MSIFTGVPIDYIDNGTLIFYDFSTHKVIGYRRKHKINKLLVIAVLSFFAIFPVQARAKDEIGKIIIPPLITRPYFLKIMVMYFVMTIIIAFILYLIINHYMESGGRIDKEFDDSDLENAFISLWRNFKSSSSIKTSIYTKAFAKQYFKKLIQRIILLYSVEILILLWTSFTTNFEVRYFNLVLCTPMLSMTNCIVYLTLLRYLIYKNMKKNRLR